MAKSLRAKLSKLRHDGHITDAEYQAFIKKMDGHDAEIRNKAIDEFAKSLKTDYVNFDLYYILENNNVAFEFTSLKSYRDMIDELAEQMKAGAE